MGRLFCLGYHNRRFERFGFLGSYLGVGDDYYRVADGDQAGGSAVQADTLGTALSADYVSYQTGTVGYIHNVNLLAVNDAGCIHPVAVNGYATYVVDVGIGHLDTVQL